MLASSWRFFVAIFFVLTVCTHGFMIAPCMLRFRPSASRDILSFRPKSILHVGNIAKMTASASETATAFSPRGMNVEDFFANSVGAWKSLRSSHNIAFGQIEEVNSNIEISPVSATDPELLQICEIYKADPKSSCSSVRFGIVRC